MCVNDHGHTGCAATARKVLCSAVIALLCLIITPFGAQAAEKIVIKAVVNGETKSDYFAVITPDNDLLIAPDDLRSMGLRDGRWTITEINGMPYVSVRSLEGAAARFDKETLSLFLTVPARMLGARPVIDLNPQRPQRVYFPDEFSAFLNYSANYVKTNPLGLDTLTLSNKIGVHSGKLLFLTDTIYIKNELRENFVRLLSSVTYEERDDRRRYVVGDAFASTGALGSTVNVGGISISKVYQVDPYFIKRPMFYTTGLATYPSEASIYLDGALIRKDRLPPGEFEIKNLNYFGGAHQVDVVMRDPFGHETKMTYPVYFSDAVLGRGLHDYNYTVGSLRNQYGSESNDYGKLAFSAYHRYGVTNTFTLGGWAEGSDGLSVVGPEAAYAFPRAGTISVSLGSSRDHGKTGLADSVNYSYQRGAVVLRLSSSTFSKDYLTLQGRTMLERPHREQGVGASYSAGAYGAFALDIASLSRYGGSDQTIVTATCSRTFFRTLLAHLTVRKINDALSGDSYEVFIGMNYSPIRDTIITAQHYSTASTNAESLQIEKTVPTGEGFGYRVGIDSQRTETGTSSSANPGVLYRGRIGTYSADYRYSSTPAGHGEQYSVTAAGAVVYAGGFLGLARPVNDSFGIVKIDRLQGVDIKWNGENMGRTDADGRLIIPELRSYNVNQITLDPGDVSLEYKLDKVSIDVSPSQWSGSCMAVRVDKMQAFVGRLLAMQGGRPVPVEFNTITMMDAGREARFLTGQNGEFYFENTVLSSAREGVSIIEGCRDAGREKDQPAVITSGSFKIIFKYQDKSCSAVLLVPAREDIIVDLGNVVGACEDASTAEGL